MTQLITYVLLALGFSFLCSVMEAVLLSVTPSYVHMKEEQGDPAAARLRKLKSEIDRPLAAILSLNTIAHTVGAAAAGAQSAVVFGNAAVGIFSAVLTLLILLVSEIIPKTLGARYWRTLAPWLPRVLVPVIWLMWPLVKLSEGVTLLLSRGKKETSVSREEIAALAELGREAGVFEEEESRILKNLFRFGSLRVRDVMTPRIVLVAFPEKQSVGQVLREHQDLRFSRIPVYRTNVDEVTGYVLKDELLLKAALGESETPLHVFKREILVVPDSLPLPDLFERLLQRVEHIALVVDEYGGTAGVVTLEDVVETLLGLEIVDEADSVRDMQAMARRRWLRRASRLGLVPEDADGNVERRAIIRFGITGGEPPRREPPDAGE